nr:hypothetical protein [Pseudomonas sp. BIGb0427]
MNYYKRRFGAGRSPELELQRTEDLARSKAKAEAQAAVKASRVCSFINVFAVKGEPASDFMDAFFVSGEWLFQKIPDERICVLVCLHCPS